MTGSYILRDFYPRPPRGGRRIIVARSAPSHRISIHALREEGDLGSPVSIYIQRPDFYPRPPRGGRRALSPASAKNAAFLSTPSAHALREEGDVAQKLTERMEKISIHALREEGDAVNESGKLTAYKFLSTPSARRATQIAHLDIPAFRFLSTPSARRATHEQRMENLPECISIHALREEGDVWLAAYRSKKPISIHALREEGDPICAHQGDLPSLFLSTPSARRATPGNFICAHLSSIFLSTPSARRATQGPDTEEVLLSNFYPRPPRGGRRT